MIGKGASISQRSGNQHLRRLAAQVLQSYTDCSDRREKTKIVDQLLAATKAASPVGAFVKQVGVNTWVEVSDKKAREKIGYTLRDLAPYRYRSSTQSKSATRRQKLLLSDDGNRAEAHFSRDLASSLRDSNMEISSELPIRRLPVFPSSNHGPLINLPEARPVMNDVMVAAPLHLLQRNRFSALGHNAATPEFARGIVQAGLFSSQEEGPVYQPPRILEHSPFPVRKQQAPLDPRTLHSENQPGVDVHDMLEPSVFASPGGFTALPPHITVAEAILSQGTSTMWVQQHSGQVKPLYVQNSTTNESLNRRISDQKDKPTSADDLWALALESSPEGSDDHRANDQHNNKNDPA